MTVLVGASQSVTASAYYGSDIIFLFMGGFHIAPGSHHHRHPWVLLAKIVFKPEIDELPGCKTLFDTGLNKLGKTSGAERRVA